MILRYSCQKVDKDARHWAGLLFGRADRRALRLSRLRGIQLARSMSAELACRELLADLLPEGPYALAEDELGKPYLPESRFHVSLSHSGNYVAAAVADVPVGIDIQTLRIISDRVLLRWFSPAEREWIGKAGLPERAIRLWTMKEAYGKLQGLGIFRGKLFRADFSAGQLITEYDDVAFTFPEAPEGLLYTVCVAKNGASL